MVMTTASNTRTRAGTNVELRIGATRITPETRINGHSTAAIESSN